MALLPRLLVAGESSGKRSTRSSSLRRSKSGGATEASAPAAAPAAREAGGAGPSGSKTSADDALRSALAARAKRFKALYFTDAQGHVIGEWHCLPVIAFSVWQGGGRKGAALCSVAQPLSRTQPIPGFEVRGLAVF